MTRSSKELFAQKRLQQWKRILVTVACFALLTTFGMATAYAQDPDDPNTEIPLANQQLRAFAAQEVMEGAAHFNISAQKNNLAVLSRDDLVSVSANFANVNELELADLRNGANVGFLFVSSTRPNPFLATGFYIVRIFVLQAANGNAEVLSQLPNTPHNTMKALAVLINEGGSVVATLPAEVKVGSPIVAKSALPIHTLKLGVDTYGLNLHWNTTSGKSINLSYSIPLDQ